MVALLDVPAPEIAVDVERWERIVRDLFEDEDIGLLSLEPLCGLLGIPPYCACTAKGRDRAPTAAIRLKLQILGITTPFFWI